MAWVAPSPAWVRVRRVLLGVCFFLYHVYKPLSNAVRATALSFAAKHRTNYNGITGTTTEPTLCQQLELRTRRTLSIGTALTDGNLAKCNPQAQCPLYQLPKELRDMIFVFATAPYEDPQRRYKDTAFYCRPGHTARHRTETNLLLTCRRAWLEANALPMQQAEHAFFFTRGPYNSHFDANWFRNNTDENVRYREFLERLTKRNLRNVTNVHLFAQMFLIERFPSRERLQFFRRDKVMLGFKPKVFYVTIRHCDWWNWETDEPLRLDDRWVQYLLNTPCLSAVEEFRLELETLERKQAQLQPIIERLRRLEGTPRQAADSASDGNVQASKLVMKDAPQIWHWTGPARLHDKEYEPYRGLDKLRYHVTVLAWRSIKLPPLERCPAATSSTARSVIPSLPVQDRLRPGETTAHAMRRARLKMPRLDKENDVRKRAADQATAAEEARRQVFERAIGDIEVKRLLEQWAANGSLLKFEG